MTNLLLQFVDVDTSAKKFGDWLRLHRKKAMLSMEALGRKVGVSKQYISVLERAENHALTGKPVTPDREKVVALAKAVGGDEDEALNKAGYASTSEKIPKLPEFLYQIDWDKLKPVLHEIESFLKFKLSELSISNVSKIEPYYEDAEPYVEFSEEEVLELIELHNKINRK